METNNQDGKKEFKISKTFNRKISANFGNSIDVSTTLSTTIYAGSGEELASESAKLFEQAKHLTIADIEANKQLIDGALAPRNEQTW
jgi:hypothetical protein